MVLFTKTKKIVSVFILFLTIGFSNSVSSQNELDYKVMMGYQGWFLAPGDGSTTNNPWNHWFSGGTTATPDPANLTVDMWPDMSEYTDKFNTNMTYADGSNAQLFSSYSLSTTRKHFEWMRDYNVHGIYLQRFLSAVDLQTSGSFKAKNKVLENVISSAAEYNRKYAVMYDLSIGGTVTDATMYAKIVADWEYLVDTYDILNEPEYVKQNGKPVVAIWGIGFKGRGLTTATFQAIIDYFKTNADPKYRAYVMGGVPEGWNTLSGASEMGDDWTAVYNSLDMISPWSVGRYSNNSGADSFKNSKIVPDLASCNANNIDYMPVIWPGFSWLNLKNATLNVTPRNGGQFYWRQAYNAVQAGVKFIYVAMFDEVDEGTAMFKITDTKAKLPIQAKDILVSLDIDGFNLPSDWYLQLADQTQKMLDGTIPLTSFIPITPPGVDYYVKAGGNNNGGRTEANSFSTVDAAVAAATDGDKIIIVGSISQTGQILLSKSLSFVGQNNTTINGVDGGTVANMYELSAAGLTVSFTDIIFQGSINKSVSNGAVFSITGASGISFTNCTFNGNTTSGAFSGAAISISNGTLTITNSLFKNNTAGKSGGAISVFATATILPQVTITGTNFYNNSAQGLGGSDGGGAIFAEGLSITVFPTVSVTNCTFFENKITRDNFDYGAIRSTNASVSVTNSLFYNNKINGGAGVSSDFGATAAGIQSFTYSLGQQVRTNVDSRDSSTITDSDFLSASNIAWDNTLNKVTFTAPNAITDPTPIDFSAAKSDVGAWDSKINLFRGTTDSNWATALNWSSTAIPTSLENVNIIGNATNQPIISTLIGSINSLTIASGATLTVNSASHLTVVGTMTLQNNANLIQGDNSNIAVGSSIVKRNSNPLKRLDYTMWSSPVSGAQTLADFSPKTSQSPNNRFYTYDPANNSYTNVAPTTTFATGRGYLIRMPNEDPTTNYNTGGATLAYPGQFTGTLNNGDVTLGSVTPLVADKYYSVGNPYPSSISASSFIAGTPGLGTTLYFWRKTNNTPNGTDPSGNGTAYATWTSLGGTGTASGNVSPNDLVPNGQIAVGQGFIVNTGTATTINFTNTMRTGTTATFLKTKATATPDRVWLNLTNATGAFSQTLIGYTADATLGVDNGIDGEYINDSPLALTSNIKNKEYTIQGRPAFDPTDVVALNFKTDAAGDYTIALGQFDGVFATGQDVYLADSKPGTETDLKAGSYTFNAAAGIDNARFSLKYQKTLKVDSPEFNENSVTVYKNNGTLYVNSGKVAINSIQVYDVQGRLIAERKNVKSSRASLDNLKANNQVLLVKISGEDNSVVTKKVLN